MKNAPTSVTLCGLNILQLFSASLFCKEDRLMTGRTSDHAASSGRHVCHRMGEEINVCPTFWPQRRAGLPILRTPGTSVDRGGNAGRAEHKAPVCPPPTTGVVSIQSSDVSTVEKAHLIPLFVTDNHRHSSTKIHHPGPTRTHIKIFIRIRIQILGFGGPPCHPGHPTPHSA